MGNINKLMINTILIWIVGLLAYLLYVFCLCRKHWQKIDLKIKTAGDRVMKIKSKYIKTRFLIYNNSWDELDELVVQLGTLRFDINTLIEYKLFIQKRKLLVLQKEFLS